MGYWKDKKNGLLFILVFGLSTLALLFSVFMIPFLFSILEGIYIVIFAILGIVLCIVALFLIDYKDYNDKNIKKNTLVVKPKKW